MDWMIQQMRERKVPLVFGNTYQIEAIRRYERKEEEKKKQCAACYGEGHIPCGHCNGTGESK